MQAKNTEENPSVYSQANSSIYSEAYSENSYQKHQKQFQENSVGRSTGVNQSEKYFKNDVIKDNYEKPLRSPFLRSKNRNKNGMDEDDDDYNQENLEKPANPEYQDPIENEQIKSGCCMNKFDKCILF